MQVNRLKNSGAGITPRSKRCPMQINRLMKTATGISFALLAGHGNFPTLD